METFKEQFDLLDIQLHTLNEAQALYPVKNEQITIKLTDTKITRSFDTTDAFLDVYLDSIIIHQSLDDDYKIAVFIGDELLFESYITKIGHNNIKKALEAEAILMAAKRRKDPRPVKYKTPEPIPDWATTDEDTKTLPAQMLLAPNAADAEEALSKNEEIKHANLKVKNLPIQDVPVAHLNIEKDFVGRPAY